MRRLGLVTGLALSLAGPALSAEDLENLFDSASQPNTKAKTVAEANAPAGGVLHQVLAARLRNPHPDQALFLRYLDAGEWDKALLQYLVAFERTDFQKSADGRALFAYAHFKAGLPVTSLEMLFAVDQPGKIHPELRRLWKEAAAPTHPAWGVAQVKWNSGFAEIFPAETEFRVVLRNLAQIKDIKALEQLYARMPANSMERAQAGWQLVIAQSVANKVEDAAKVLAELMKAQPLPVSRDLMELTAARLLFQRAHYAAAAKYYEKVERASEYWPDAQEEMAWAFVRRGEPQNSLGVSQSLVTSAMANQVGAESYFVHALGQLKTCDYSGVLATLTAFPKAFRGRLDNLNKTASTSDLPEAERAVNLLKTKRIARQDLGKDAQMLPRLIARDERLFVFAQALAQFEAEAKSADVVYSKSLALTGLQGYFEKLRKSTLGRAHTAKAAAHSRVKELAKIEAGEIKEILRKLHIVEAEVIQQVALAERVIKNTQGPINEKKGQTGSKAQDVLKFPASEDVWFDEIGNFRVDMKKTCQAAAKDKST